jgi:hypothetical protein
MFLNRGLCMFRGLARTYATRQRRGCRAISLCPTPAPSPALNDLSAAFCLQTAKLGVASLDMGTIHRFPAARSLEPADLEIAASVYVELVNRLALETGDEASRETIAQGIIDRMMLGERDPDELCDAALAKLRLTRIPDPYDDDRR